jgi:16S rRNA (cytidine1402-2'-O)-methyltransferase
MSKLYVVATPIGNLKDITLRALEVFKSVDTIVCEDTRVTSKLLAHYNIKKPLLSYHQQSKASQVNKVIELIKAGKDLAYVSDAGTPGIQDPGGKLIQQILTGFSQIPTGFSQGTSPEGGLNTTSTKVSRNLTSAKAGQNLQIIPIPGASAVTALASVSGLPTDSFLFLGFMPKKRKQKVFEEIVNSNKTVIFYESGHRILKTLTELNTLLSHPEHSRGISTTPKHNETSRQARSDKGERQVVIGRELTKKFETIHRGFVQEVLEQLEKSSTKGEFVVLIK